MELDLSSAGIYTEFSGLSKLKLAAKNNSPEALQVVAEQFEAFFLQLMLKQMRDSSLAEGIFDSDKTRFYQDMMDQQMALDMAKQHSIGIADSIVRQLQHTVKTDESMQLKPLPSRPGAFNPVMRKGSINSFNSFSSPSDFINAMRPYAEQAAAELGVPANVLLAQSALETGWGQKIIRSNDGNSSHNLFGIKADSRWQGESVRVGSLEYRDGTARQEVSAFRVYDSYQESFRDYVDFIKSNERYSPALRQVNSSGEYIKALQEAGYATDPEYADKVMTIIKREAI